MRFIVDGYNVAMADPATAGLPAEEQRAALVRRLAARGQALLGCGAILVVFDGVSDGCDAAAGAVQVRFSGGVAADEVILALAGPGVTVVTSDRGLQARAEGKGAQVLPASAAFEAAQVKKARPRRYPASTVGLPKGANLITEEMKRIWLADDGSEE